MKKFIIISMIFAMLIFASIVKAVVDNFQPSQSYDAEFDSLTARDNTSPYIRAGGYFDDTEQDYIQINSVLKIDISSISNQAIVNDAGLSLWVSDNVVTTDFNVCVYALSNSYNHNYVSWLDRTDVLQWSVAGGDYYSTVLGCILFSSLSDGQQWFDLDTVEFQKLIDGTNSYNGFLLIPSCISCDYIGFYSSESVENLMRPMLSIDYTLPETPTATITETPTATITETSTATFTETPTATFTETPTATFTETTTATYTITPSDPYALLSVYQTKMAREIPIEYYYDETGLVIISSVKVGLFGSVCIIFSLVLYYTRKISNG